MISATVYGPVQGARRHRSRRSGHQYHSEEHLSAEGAWVDAWLRAMAAGGWTQPITGPVSLRIVTYHARPARLCRKRDRGGGPIPYTGKPDADNIAKLVMDAATKAGVWKDDTCVADLHVLRWYTYLGLNGAQAPVRVWAGISRSGGS